MLLTEHFFCLDYFLLGSEKWSKCKRGVEWIKQVSGPYPPAATDLPRQPGAGPQPPTAHSKGSVLLERDAESHKAELEAVQSQPKQNAGHEAI